MLEINKEYKKELANICSEIFYNNDISHISIEDIILELRISEKVFYKYFKTKDEIVNEYIQNHFNKLFILVDGGIFFLSTYRAKIMFFMNIFNTLIITDKKFMYIFIEFLKITSDNKNIKTYEYFKENQNVIKIFIEKGISQNEFNKCEVDRVSYKIVSYLLSSAILSPMCNEKEDEFTLSLIENILDSISS